MTSKASYYEILSLPPTLQNEPVLPAQVLRRAYKRALLQNHPDRNLTPQTYSVDQITDAYAILGDQKKRARYDKELRLRAGGEGRGKKDVGYRTGMEVVDLDDLEVDERGEGRAWYKGCRCGDERGFEVLEGELEDAAGAGEGEVMVGCRGCSLWLRVLFGILEEEGMDARKGEAEVASKGEHGGERTPDS